MYIFNIIQFLDGNVIGREVVLVIISFDNLLNSQINSVL